MATKLKALLLIVATFVLGGLLGALVNGVIASRQSENLKTRPVGPLFTDIIEHIVRPGEGQQEEVKNILDRYAKIVAAEMEAFGERMSRITDSLQNELAPLLTPEQRQRLTEALQPPPRRVFGGFGREVDVLREKLDLDERQVSDIRAIYDDLRREMESRFEKGLRDPLSGRDKVIEIHRRVEERIKTVLTPEQRKKYEELLEFLPRGEGSGGSVFFFRGGPGSSRQRDSLFMSKEPR